MEPLGGEPGTSWTGGTNDPDRGLGGVLRPGRSSHGDGNHRVRSCYGSLRTGRPKRSWIDSDGGPWGDEQPTVCIPHSRRPLALACGERGGGCRRWWCIRGGPHPHFPVGDRAPEAGGHRPRLGPGRKCPHGECWAELSYCVTTWPGGGHQAVNRGGLSIWRTHACVFEEPCVRKVAGRRR